MSTYRLYIVECGDGTLYTGIALDVSARLGEHRDSPRGARYLRGRGPIKLVFEAIAGDRGRALRLEYRVKRLRREQKLALIRGEFDLARLAD